MIPALTALSLDKPESLAAHDALVVVSPTPLEKHLASLALPAAATAALESALAIDAALGRGARPPVVLPAAPPPPTAALPPQQKPPATPPPPASAEGPK